MLRRISTGNICQIFRYFWQKEKAEETKVEEEKAETPAVEVKEESPAEEKASEPEEK